jgi:hypothetical protein
VIKRSYLDVDAYCGLSLVALPNSSLVQGIIESMWLGRAEHFLTCLGQIQDIGFGDGEESLENYHSLGRMSRYGNVYNENTVCL